jgi:RNA 3'-terminal phosphate cyclase (ATP)
MLAIDGSQGEGGGQILRSSLALSLVTGQPFRIERIRAGRRRAGLLKQHLAAVQAAAEIAGARVEGDALGSEALGFHPGSVRPGRYRFAVGSAGSAMLVLETVLPALLLAPAPSQLTLEGGTHNPFAPPFDFVARALLPLLGRMGALVRAKLVRPGFYPAGGGCVEVDIEPAPRLERLELLERGPIVRRAARALVARLPRAIGERELARVRAGLGWPAAETAVEEIAASAGPGNVVCLELESAELCEVFTAFGERGKPAERVADEACAQAHRYLEAGVPVGESLADQLLLPLVIARGGAFRTVELSQHARTNIEVLRRFVSLELRVVELGEDRVQLELEIR